MISCCNSQTIVPLVSDVIKEKCRSVCAHCGRIMWEGITDFNVIVFIGDSKLDELRRAHGFGDLADRQKAFLKLIRSL